MKGITVNKNLERAVENGVVVLTVNFERASETPYEPVVSGWLTNLPIGHVTVLAERAVGVLRDKKPGAYFREDKLTVVRGKGGDDGGKWNNLSIGIAAKECATGGPPFDQMEVVVVGMSHQEAIGALGWFIREFGEMEMAVKQDTKGELRWQER